MTSKSPLVPRPITIDRFYDLLGAVPPIGQGRINNIEYFFMGECMGIWELSDGSRVDIYLLVLSQGDLACEVLAPLNTSKTQYQDFINQIK
jgi:hypothetical protein